MEGLIIRPGRWSVEKYDTDISDYSVPVSTKETIVAKVPGCVQYDLIVAGYLENPYAGTKEAFASAWVAESDWLYETVFIIPEDAKKYPYVGLKLWGIDTFSEVWLNGKLIGETENAYISYEFPIEKSVLVSGENYLQIRIKSHKRMVESKLEQAKCLKRGNETEGLLGKSLIRRYQRSFFTTSSLLNIGTGVLGIGINRPVELKFYPEVHLLDVSYKTIFIGDQAEGEVSVTVNKATDNAEVRVRILDQEGNCVWENTYRPIFEEVRIPVQIQNPILWWPAGYGEPYLYKLEVVVRQNGEVNEKYEKCIGIRIVKIIQALPNGRKTFYFEVNGQKIFVHGENYIPLDYIKVYGTKEQYENLFLLLEKQHVNLVRIWGGGTVEDDSFFEKCDKKGIMIWHDLFLHSNVYPDYDSGFLKNFLAETEGILKTIRSHPCICVICGGNEQFEGWDEYGWKQELDRFYGSTLPLTEIPKLTEMLCPEIPYVYNSPYGGKYAQSPVEGDCHCWGNYYNASKDPLFVTETCWTSESYSRPETLKKYMDLDVDAFIGIGWVEKWHERTSLPFIGRRHFSSWFDFRSLRSYLYGLELEEARADYHALSQFRFMDPSNSGIVYWSFNKGGPLFQFGCVDYDGRPMMSYYVVQRLYRDIAVFPCRDCKNVRVFLSNHGTVSINASVQAWHMDDDGKILRAYEENVTCEVGDSICAMVLTDLYAEVVDRTKETLFVCAKVGSEVVSEDLLLFCPYSELEIVKKPIYWNVLSLGEGEWELTLQSEGIVQMLAIESSRKIVCDDNYFPMMPGEEKKVRIMALDKIGQNEQTQIRLSLLGEQKIGQVTL